jgi:hypothetical protein
LIPISLLKSWFPFSFLSKFKVRITVHVAREEASSLTVAVDSGSRGGVGLDEIQESKLVVRGASQVESAEGLLRVALITNEGLKHE